MMSFANSLISTLPVKLTIERVAAYSQYDMDGDGLLSAEELAIACGISVYEAKQYIFEFDENGDGMLDEAEFNELKKTIKSKQQKEEENEDANEMFYYEPRPGPRGGI